MTELRTNQSSNIVTSNVSSSNEYSYLAECTGAVYYLTKAPEGEFFINYLALIVANALLSVLGATANLLVLLAYFKKLRRNSHLEFNTTLLAFLAASDLLATALAQPLATTRLIMELLDQHSCIFWLIIRRLFEFTVPVSFLTVGLITYERYQALFHPIKYRGEALKLRIKRAMVGVWVFAFATTALRVFRFFALIYYVIAFLIIIALVVANTVIYFKIGRMAVAFGKNRKETSVHHDRESRRRTLSRDKRSTRTLFYIFLSLFLCYLPMAGAILYSLIKGEQSMAFLFGCLPWADMFAFLNSTLDPFIYCFRNPRLKHAVLGLLRRDRKMRKRHSRTCHEIKDSLMLQDSGSAANKNNSRGE